MIGGADRAAKTCEIWGCALKVVEIDLSWCGNRGGCGNDKTEQGSVFGIHVRPQEKGSGLRQSGVHMRRETACFDCCKDRTQGDWPRERGSRHKGNVQFGLGESERISRVSSTNRKKS